MRRLPHIYCNCTLFFYCRALPSQHFCAHAHQGSGVHGNVALEGEGEEEGDGEGEGAREEGREILIIQSLSLSLTHSLTFMSAPPQTVLSCGQTGWQM